MSDVYLWDTYEKVGREALERRDYGQAIESFRAAVTLAEQLPGEDLRLIMSLRHLASATSKTGQLSLAHDLLRRTEEMAQARLGKTHSETVQVQRDLYHLARQLGHLDEAEGFLVQVLEAVRAQGDTEEFLEVLELLAQLAGERDRLDQAALLYEQIVDARQTLYGAEHPSVAQALLWHSTALSRSGQGAAAEEPLTKAFTMLEQQFADDPKSLAQSLLAGADLMSQAGRHEAALEHQKRALTLLGRELEDNHPSLWETREMIASTLAALGRLDESIALLESCLEQRTVRDHRTGAMLKNLAGLYLTTQRLEQAESFYRQASELLERTLGPDHPAVLATLEERIQLYHFTGRSQQALDLALTTIRSTEQRYGPGHPNTAQVYASTAVLAHAAEQWNTAFELMKAAEAIWESLRPRPEDVLSNCRLNMATCLVEMGRSAEAALALQKVQAAPGSPAEKVVESLWSRLEAAEAPVQAPADNPDETTAEPAPETAAATSGAEPPQPSGEVEEDPWHLPLELESSELSQEVLPELPDLEVQPPPLPPQPEAPLGSSQEANAPPEEPEEPAAPEEPLEETPWDRERDGDRRAFPRLNLGLNRFFDLLILSPDAPAASVRSFLVDLSLGGMRVNSEQPLPWGHTFELTLPAELLSEAMTLTARVTWQRPLFTTTYIQGVEFVALTAEQRAHLERRLQQSPRQQGGRQHYRLYRPLPITLLPPSRSEWLETYASDLSLEGLGTRLPDTLTEGQTLRLRLHLEFELPTVEVQAAVAWSRTAEHGTAHGFRFQDLGPVEARTIQLYIDRCLELSPD